MDLKDFLQLMDVESEALEVRLACTQRKVFKQELLKIRLQDPKINSKIAGEHISYETYNASKSSRQDNQV